jgi:subtilisin family serine protease
LRPGSDVEGDGFPNFSGTSAAAPHAAGVAALLLEANPNATPDQVYQALEISALDMEDPYTPGSDPGYDSASGYGFIQADRALDEILGTSNTDIASSSQDTFV